MQTARTFLARALLAVALSAVAVSACGYDPDIESGELTCGPGGSCPEGYSCVSNKCWRPSNADATDFIGHWVFVPPSRRVIACDDGFTEDLTDWTDYFDVEEGGSTDLRTFYYCDLNLNIGATGATVLAPSGSCNAPDPMNPAVMFTWTPSTFTLSTSNGVNGTLTASIPYTAATSTASVMCTMNFTGTLTKN